MYRYLNWNYYYLNNFLAFCMSSNISRIHFSASKSPDFNHADIAMLKHMVSVLTDWSPIFSRCCIHMINSSVIIGDSNFLLTAQLLSTIWKHAVSGAAKLFFPDVYKPHIQSSILHRLPHTYPASLSEFLLHEQQLHHVLSTWPNSASPHYNPAFERRPLHFPPDVHRSFIIRFYSHGAFFPAELRVL